MNKAPWTCLHYLGLRFNQNENIPILVSQHDKVRVTLSDPAASLPAATWPYVEGYHLHTLQVQHCLDSKIVQLCVTPVVLSNWQIKTNICKQLKTFFS